MVKAAPAAAIGAGSGVGGGSWARAVVIRTAAASSARGIADSRDGPGLFKSAVRQVCFDVMRWRNADIPQRVGVV